METDDERNAGDAVATNNALQGTSKKNKVCRLNRRNEFVSLVELSKLSMACYLLDGSLLKKCFDDGVWNAVSNMIIEIEVENKFHRRRKRKRRAEMFRLRGEPEDLDEPKNFNTVWHQK